jgi:hypothetical protein
MSAVDPFRIPLACITALLVAAPAVPAAMAPVEDLEATLSAPSHGLVEDLLDLAGVEEALGLEPRWLDGLIGRGGEWSGAAPTDIVAHARELATAVGEARSASDVLQILRSFEGRPLAAPQAPEHGALAAEVLELYALLGAPITLDEALATLGAAAVLPPTTADAIAAIVASVNHAVEQTLAGADPGQPAADLLAAMENAIPILTTSQAASVCPAPPLFEDPLGLVIIGSTCDDIYGPRARIVQVDLGGDDTYENNAGGATGGRVLNADSPIRPELHLPSGAITFVLDSLDYFLPVNVAPLTSGLLNDEPPEVMLQNATWQAETIGSLPGRATGFVENNTRFLDLPAAVIDYATQVSVDVIIEEDRLAEMSPVAVSLDVGRGHDVYSSDRNVVQGSASIGVGILVDDGGDDTYEADVAAQGIGGPASIGILADLAGADSYSATMLAQGSGDGGFLFDLGLGDDTYTAGQWAQGGRGINLVAFAMGALVDQGGSDTYTAGAISQGAGNLLLDILGDDTYTLNAGVGQGVSSLQAPGMLIDADGADEYHASGSPAAQGASFGAAPAALVDLGHDDDVYSADGEAQGVCLQAGTMAVLFDDGGDDVYTTRSGQGLSRSACIGVLVDAAGDDAYAATSHAQGSSRASTGAITPLAGILVDAAGSDMYTSGSNSQGSGDLLSTGILIDAAGSDSYEAGDFSQGSGGRGGAGVLIDDVAGHLPVSVTTGDDADIDAGEDGFSLSPSGEVTVIVDTSEPRKSSDTYVAADYSQGSSGVAGGLGILLDNADQSISNGLPALSTFGASDWSQGASVESGIGLLVNRHGNDAYTADSGSQGAASGGLFGVLLDVSGRDDYETTDTTTSQGYGASDPNAGAPVSLGVLADTDDRDRYTGFTVPAGNDRCTNKGAVGLTMDFTVGGFLGSGCDAAVLAAATDAVNALLAFVQGILVVPPAPAGPCTGGEIFCDDVEGGPNGWTTNFDELSPSTNLWRVENQSMNPQPFGPNAHSGSQYWYVGAPGASGVTYFGGDNTFNGSYIVSPDIDLGTATAPLLEAWIAGSSELGFDFLRVGVRDSSGDLVNHVSLSGDTGGYQQYQVDLAPYVGQVVNLVFTFTSDEILEDGQGYNVDDIVVREA